MKREIELLAPGGDIDSIKAAIIAGADAIYCGIDRFNARNRAANISFDELLGVIRLAHNNNCRVFLTLNIIIVENEFQALIELLTRLTGTGIDGIIVQDIGLLYLLSEYFRGLNIHASTQLTTHNKGQIKFLHRLGVSRVNLSRELNIDEIRELNIVASEKNILTEVFVHGSYCISFSGICYLSSVQGGNSGNRGRCSQACRNKYKTTPAGLNHPLNLKDNSAYSELKDLYDAGVSSLKIEGRIKKFDYVYTVVKTWREHILNFYNNSSEGDNSDLYKVFNRDFTNSYMKGVIGKEMFIDNPRDHTVKHLSELNNYVSQDDKESDQLKLYQEKEDLKADIKERIANLNIEKASLDLYFSGKCGTPLKLLVKTEEDSFEIVSDAYLSDKGSEALDLEMITKRFRTLNKTEYNIRQLETDNIEGELYIPFSELSSIKQKVLNLLSFSKETVSPLIVPQLKKPEQSKVSPALSILISSPDDLNLCKESGVVIYYQLPASIKEKFSEYKNIFSVNPDIIPWFSSVLIGEEYSSAVELLRSVMPRRIVTNNSGIAYEAFKMGIAWIAGPYLNIVNSYSLLGLKERFNCSGAFISSEISRSQIKNIKAPDNFELYYSIYHPIVLMTSRQCLFLQTEGCEKDKMDSLCLGDCHKSASITSLKNETQFIKKEAGNYNALYNQRNFLNLDIINELRGMFSGFSIDLRNINTETRLALGKPELIKHFNKLLKGQPGADRDLKGSILNTTNDQYIKGI